MVTQTPRFNLDKYSQGEDNWSHSDTIDFVDEHSIDKGPIADRPATGDYDDQMYYATDQGLFWRWDINISDWTTDAFGTENNRVPDTSYFDGVDANSVSTDEAQIDVQTPQDASASRSLGTWYQNTESVPLYVSVTLNTSVSSGQVWGILDIDSSQTGTRADSERIPIVEDDRDQVSVEGIVSPGNYYRVRSLRDEKITYWIEYRVGQA